MAKTQPNYTKEFKQEAVNPALKSEKSKSERARDLGISDSCLRGIIHSYEVQFIPRLLRICT